MSKYKKSWAGVFRKTRIGNCPQCGIPTIVHGVLPKFRPELPPTPLEGVYRAFERYSVVPAGRGGWRITKRFGAVPAHDQQEAPGFLPHACPKSPV